MRGDDDKRRARWYHPALIAVVAIAVGVVGLALASMLGDGLVVDEDARAKDHVRTALMLLFDRSVCEVAADERERQRRLHGKNVVLELVVSCQQGQMRPEQLEWLFRPGEMPEGISAEDYAALTVDRLETERFPHLTHIYGPARDRWPLPPDRAQIGAAIFGMPIEGGIVVGYGSGDVRVVSLRTFDMGAGVERLETVDEMAAALGLSGE